MGFGRGDFAAKDTCATLASGHRVHAHPLDISLVNLDPFENEIRNAALNGHDKSEPYSYQPKNQLTLTPTNSSKCAPSTSMPVPAVPAAPALASVSVKPEARWPFQQATMLQLRKL
ncbi:hypothetical protein CHU98_g6937 [Xylaria longipes]|nr:hypothetical protein CHU98_g6937 [Xylaria longipes]